MLSQTILKNQTGKFTFVHPKTHSYNVWVGMLLHWSYDFGSDPERSHILHTQGWRICSLWGLIIIMTQTCFLTRLWFFFPVKKIEWIQVKISYEQSCLLSWGPALRCCLKEEEEEEMGWSPSQKQIDCSQAQIVFTYGRQITGNGNQNCKVYLSTWTLLTLAN